ncbi:MAG: radical SAM protein [Bacteroidales bacterium]|nr:radical SAM protein [Bacteroidales bacterium]
MATFLFDKIIFGPVASRRLGVSLGINLLPNNCKLCNFDCIYCECGWTPDEKSIIKSYHPRSLVKLTLESKLREMKNNHEELDVITFAGNGEPTMHPEFDGIIDDTVLVRNTYFPAAKIAVLSNSTLIHKEHIFRALQKIEMNILKLDSVFEHTIQLINQPRGKIYPDKLIKYLTRFNGKLIIQTLFLRGEVNGHMIDNTTEKEISAWLKALGKIKPQMVMIYTFARETPVETLQKASKEELQQIAQRVNNLGIETQISD